MVHSARWKARARMPRPPGIRLSFVNRMTTTVSGWVLLLASLAVHGRPVRHCVVGRPHQALSRQSAMAPAHLQLRSRRLRIELDVLRRGGHRKTGRPAVHRRLFRAAGVAGVRHPVLRTPGAARQTSERDVDLRFPVGALRPIAPHRGAGHGHRAHRDHSLHRAAAHGHLDEHRRAHRQAAGRDAALVFGHDARLSRSCSRCSRSCSARAASTRPNIIPGMVLAIAAESVFKLLALVVGERVRADDARQPRAVAHRAAPIAGANSRSRRCSSRRR